MANNKNLIPIRTESEAREKGKKGGIKSGEVRRKKKTLREQLEIMLSIKDDFSGKELKFEIVKALVNRALSGNIRAFEVIRDTIGEKPTDNQELQIPMQSHPKVFVTSEDIKDVKKMEQIIKNAKCTEIVYISSEEMNEVNAHINAILNDC